MEKVSEYSAPAVRVIRFSPESVLCFSGDGNERVGRGGYLYDDDDFYTEG